MIDVKGILIISTTMVLLAITIGAAFVNTGNVSVNRAEVLKAGSHTVLLIELDNTGLRSLREIVVNGERIAPSAPITIPAGRHVVLVESTKSVKLFPSKEEALLYIRSPRSMYFEGSPLPEADVYNIVLVFSDGSRISLVAAR